MNTKLKPHLLSVLILFVVTLLVYGQIINHDFQVTWDDDRYILDNPMVHGLTLGHIKQAFSAQYFGNYAPLHLISYMLDFELWQLRPGGYQAMNLLLHAVNGLLVYRLFLALHGKRFLALTGAAIFLLHPLQVESVAWVSQRKNLLAMLFFLLAWEAYRSCRDVAGFRRVLTYFGAVLLFVCAVLSKSVAVIFPVVLILYNYCFPARKVDSKGGAFSSFFRSDPLPACIKAKWSCRAGILPFIVVAGMSVILTMQSQSPIGDNWDGAGGGRVGYHGGTPLATFYSMLPVFCRYLGLFFWPSGLNAQYNPTVYTSFRGTVAIAALVLILVGGLVFRLFRYDRRLAFWAFIACVGFLPVSQIVPLVTMMNDRYVYFPMLGFAALVGAGCSYALDTFPRRSILLVYLVVGSLIAVLSLVSFQRAGVWKDSISLWSDSAAKSPAVSSPWIGLAQAYERTGNGMVSEAIEAYGRAFALDPSNAYTLYGLARIYGFTGQYDKALQYTNALLQQSPDHVMGVTLLGTIYERQNKYDLAEQSYRRAEMLQPESVDIAMQLANLALVRGDLATAMSRYRRIEARGENFPVVAYILSWLELRAGHDELALTWLEKALKRGYAEYRSLADLEELTALRGNPRFEQLLRQYGGGQN